MPDLQRINFHNHQISTCRNEQTGKVYCLPREIAGQIGMNWSGQFTKLTTSALYKRHVSRLDIQTPGGIQDTLLLDIDFLPAWLASISIDKVNPDIRDALLAYQDECAQVLRDYWTTGIAINHRATDPPASLLSTERIALLKESFDFLVFLGMADDRDRLMYADIARTLTRQEFLPQHAGDGAALALPPPQGFFVAERVASLGYQLTRKEESTHVSKIARLIVSEYRSRYGTEPSKAQRYVDGAVRLINWYPQDEASWVDTIIQRYLADYAEISRAQKG